jgi:hypothetical protein
MESSMFCNLPHLRQSNRILSRQTLKVHVAPLGTSVYHRYERTRQQAQHNTRVGMFCLHKYASFM